MYFNKLPGSKYFAFLSALIVIFLAITFNGIMNFSQFVSEVSTTSNHIGQTFLGFMRGFLLIMIGFLIMLIIIITRTFVTHNKETFKTLVLLGATKTKIAKKLQLQFLKHYALGIFAGLFSIALGYISAHYSQISLAFLKELIKESTFTITFIIVPFIILIVSISSSMAVTNNQLHKIK